MADSNDTTLSYDASLGLGVLPRDVLGVGDGFEEFELREPEVTVGVSMVPLRYVWQGDATGDFITLAEVSGPLHKLLGDTKEIVGCLLDWTKSGGKKSCLASCFRGVREFSLRHFAS